MKDSLFYTPTTSDVSWKRIDSLHHVMKKRTASICSQRALLYAQSFQEGEGEPYIIRRAKAFIHTLAHMDIYIQPYSLTFGDQASTNFAAPIFPEYSMQWVTDKLEAFDQRSGDAFQISGEVEQNLKRIVPYWLQHTHENEVSAYLNEGIRLAEKQGVLHRGGISMSGDGHIIPDHGVLSQRGLRSIIDEARRVLINADLQDTQRSYYQAVIISLRGALPLFQRFAELAEEVTKHEQDEKRKQELRAIAYMVGTMMEQRARNSYEEVEVCYMVHILQMIKSNGHSFCYDRPGQYMRKLYGQDIGQGVPTKDQALEIITHMFIMNSSCNEVCPHGHTKYSQDYPFYSNLVVGGKTPQRNDDTNELFYLCIEAIHLASLAELDFSVRYHLETPRQFLKAAALLIHTGCGMPNMFDDEVAAKGIEDLAIPKRGALDYCPIDCVETGVPGKYGHRTTGMAYVNWDKISEILLHNNVDPTSGVQMSSANGQDGDAVAFGSYEELWQSWEKLLKFYSDISVECDAICDDSLVRYDTDPFASCFMQDSMKLGKTLKEGSCRCNMISQSNIGPCVVGNASYAIKKPVFEGQSVTWEELMTAMQDNWQSLESARTHKKVHHVTKFGNDDDAMDEIVKGVFDSCLKLLPQYRTQRYQ